tara:strand:- start:81 stop:1730 length:1650 start_codon:yes stop_codon:yes gene_type:complete
MSITILPNINDIYSEEFYIHNKIRVNIKDIPLCLSNTFRRIVLSELPCVAFDDTWNDHESKRYITINKNNSGLHNEFLAHRLSLIPIHIYNNNTRDILKIKTMYNHTTQAREYQFNSEDIPIFHLYINAEKQLLKKESKNRYGLFEVTTHHIEYSSEYSSDIDCSEYFQPDLDIKEQFTENEYIILNMLKSDEELDVSMKPTIGLPKHNSRYCSVGTIEFMFEQDETKFDDVFQQTIEYENKERISKNLSRLNDSEIKIKHNSFMVLDKERVYKKNKYDEPNSFNILIESIGVLPSHQIVFDALTILKLKLYDIIHSFNNFKQYSDQIIYDTDFSYENKINVVHSIDNLYGYKIIIKNENHTIGNTINYYMNTLFVKNYITNEHVDLQDLHTIPPIDSSNIDLSQFRQPILEQCGYKMPHPLKEEIEFKCKCRNDLSDELINELYAKYSLELKQIYNIQSSSDQRDISIIDKQKIICIYICVKSMLSIIEIISNLSSQWIEETTKVNHTIDTSSFIVGDTKEYFTFNHGVDETRSVIEQDADADVEHLN